MKQREKTVSILDRLSWSVQPPKGLIKGCYYREEARFSSCFNGDLGHLGVLEVVADDGRIVMVEFNEQCSPTFKIWTSVCLTTASSRLPKSVPQSRESFWSMESQVWKNRW